jgi:medium-chain acyl-[acyl-carrier-protein] hydrolase
MTTATDTANHFWFILPQPNPDATARLFCFHHAGGNASFFYHWAKQLDPMIELVLVQLPGRGISMGAPFLTEMNMVIFNLYTAILKYSDKPYYFFGHSLGALMAFELAHILQKYNKPLPKCLFVSAKSPPHLSSNTFTHHLSDKDFIEIIKKYNGLPLEILEDSSLLNLFLPIIRADFKLLETYTYDEKLPLFCDLIALGGTEDHIVKPHNIEKWQSYTAANFNYHLLPGDHFFVKTQQQNVLEILSRTMAVC